MTKTTNAMRLMQRERERQVAEEGYITEHDDQFIRCELCRAAEAYWSAGLALIYEKYVGADDAADKYAENFPWEREFFKVKKDAIQNLVIGGALMLAEGDRYRRAGETLLAQTTYEKAKRMAEIIESKIAERKESNPEQKPLSIEDYRLMAQLVGRTGPTAPQRIEELLENPPHTMGIGTIRDLQDFAKKMARIAVEAHRTRLPDAVVIAMNQECEV